jgi:hypothetical protein
MIFRRLKQTFAPKKLLKFYPPEFKRQKKYERKTKDERPMQKDILSATNELCNFAKR